MIKELTIEHIIHKEDARVFLRFVKDEEACILVKKLLNGKWSATHGAWHIAYEERVFEKVCDLFFKYNVRVFKKNEYTSNETIKQINNARPVALPGNELSAETQNKLKEFKYWMSARRYSLSTINTYTEGLKVFLRFFTQLNMKII